MNRHRGLVRLLAVAVAAIVMGAALGACGSDGGNGSQAELDAQDRAVATANKIEKQNEAKMKEALRKLWTERARKRRAAAARYRARHTPRPTVIVGGASSSAGDICAPIRPRFGGKAGRAERQWRLMQRKRVLDYLNLSCSSFNRPRV